MDRNSMARMGATIAPELVSPFVKGGQSSVLTTLFAQQLMDPATGLMRAVNAFLYTPPEWNPLTAGTIAERTVQISNTHDFFVFAVVGYIRDPAAPYAEDADAAVSIQIQADASDSFLTERATDWQNVVGTARNPFYLPVPLFWRGGTSITLTAQNFMATDVRARVAFVGSRVYYGPIGG